MKKIISAILCVCLTASVISLAGCGKSSNQTTINVYNWGEYINVDDDVIGQFEDETGIKVNYTTFDSNESMYSKISGSAADYDVVIPSDYMIAKMISEKMLAKLNFDNIPNYKYIGDAYKNLEFDKNNEYSVPYTWGTTVIIYNKTMVDKADVKNKSLDLLWNKKYSGQILMFNNPRDAFGLALTKLGYSMNSTKKSEWESAAKILTQQKSLVQAYVMDQIFDKMKSGEAAIAPYYAGDALTMQQENSDLDFYIPKEGANLFVDSMCVLAASQHKTQAEQFINFMCKTDIAVLNAEAIGYATPQTQAKKQLDKTITSNENVYPDDEFVKNHTEVFSNLPDSINSLQSQLWTDIKKS